MKGRLRELDFLRGMAIFLVLLRHIPLFSWTKNMGWIGVDLFFVLSGFLVSGLLFKEYIRFGSIDVKLFLIRRGFKIYPIYYLFYIPYLIILIASSQFSVVGFLSDMAFVQNYIWGWGYAFEGSWSLAVEEHFYFGFSTLLFLSLKNRWVTLLQNSGSWHFPKVLIVFIVLCLTLRLLGNLVFDYSLPKLFTSTHFRIDSLLMGVLISYLYYFEYDWLTLLFQRHKYKLVVAAVLCVAWTPFFDPVYSLFVRTVGFTLLYISFGFMLIVFLLAKNINVILNRAFSKFFVDIVSQVGFCSYSIYIIFTLVITLCKFLFMQIGLRTSDHVFVFFLLAISGSLIVGIWMTHRVEKYFLSIRNYYFPNRVAADAAAKITIALSGAPR